MFGDIGSSLTQSEPFLRKPRPCGSVVKGGAEIGFSANLSEK